MLTSYIISTGSITNSIDFERFFFFFEIVNLSAVIYTNVSAKIKVHLEN